MTTISCDERRRIRKDLGTEKPSVGRAWASDCTEQMPVILTLVPSSKVGSSGAPDWAGKTTEKTKPPEDSTMVGSLASLSSPINSPSSRTNPAS